MDTSEFISAEQKAYAQALLSERKKVLRENALKKVSVITRVMSSEEKAAYLSGPSFEKVLQSFLHKDSIYQGLLEGKLLSSKDQKEFSQIQSLISDALRCGDSLDIPFLQAVKKACVKYSEARNARVLMAKNAPLAVLEEVFPSLTQSLADRFGHFLENGDFSRYVSPESTDQVFLAVEDLIQKSSFTRWMNEIFFPSTCSRHIQELIYRRYPVLKRCRRIPCENGKKLEQILTQIVEPYKQRCYKAIQSQYSAPAIQARLRRNPGLQDMQKEADLRTERERQLKAAFLKAIPPHYRDLFPLARTIRRTFLLHLGPTNSGKTFESVQRLRGARQGIYLGPLRLLAFEQFEELNLTDTPCSLVTGEEEIQVPGSHVQASTIEMLDLTRHYDVAVVDECQMITDRDRGGAWSAAVLGLYADEIHLCASPDAEQLLCHLIDDCGDTYTIVRHQRMAPLKVDPASFDFPKDVMPGDALIVFSKMRVHAVAAELKNRGHSVSLIYGALPPDVRRNQAERFRRGENEIVVSTDAIAMGMNLPIRRVVFLENQKYDGDIVRPLTDSEIRQIAGRAGRYGQYDVGYVNAYGFKRAIAHSLSRPAPQLTEAVIRFPESLLGIPLPLSQILIAWINMQDNDCFSKASTQRMLALTESIEDPKSDKTLIYRFVTIPFDETDTALYDVWKHMYRTENRGEHLDVRLMLPELTNPDDAVIGSLDRLEDQYKLCDLLYNYARLFLPDPYNTLAMIQHRKDLISQGIIHILSTQKLHSRTCKICRRPLPWNWPYSMCDRCHFSHTGSHSRGSDMWDDQWS